MPECEGDEHSSVKLYPRLEQTRGTGSARFALTIGEVDHMIDPAPPVGRPIQYKCVSFLQGCGN